VVDVGAPCRCARPWCAERDLFAEPRRADERLAHAIALGPEAIVLAGGDALAHPEIERLVARVGEAAIPLGLALPSPRAVPLASDALTLDVHDRDDVEAHAASLAAASTHAAREVRVLLWDGLVSEPSALAALVRAISASLRPEVLRVVAPLDAIGLASLEHAARAVELLARASHEAELAFETSPLSAGSTWRARMVAISPRRDR
jgi:hypothetical protein